MRIWLTAVAVACASSTITPEATQSSRHDSDVNPLAATLLEFQERIDDYMDLREDLADEVGDADVTRKPGEILARENALSARIRAHRVNAKHGDIFTPEIRAAFRRLVKPEVVGTSGRDLRSTLQEDAPAPGAVQVEVNSKYPAGVPFTTTPPNIIASLPRLPDVLQYRFVGRDLILLDQPADVILDYIRNVVP